MRIHAELRAYNDWVPVPKDTEVTPEDIASLRVKQMTDESFHMKVTFEEPTTHDMLLPEIQIAQRMASQEKLGRAASRAEVLVEICRKTWAHHMDFDHLAKIHVTDADPDPTLYAQCLTDAGVLDEARRAKAMERYTKPLDAEKYLNVVFMTESV